MHLNLAALQDVFFEEAAEHLQALERELLELEGGPVDRPRIDKIFRAAHSLKGGALTVGFADVARVTHEVETIIERMRQGQLAVVGGRIDLLLAAGDLTEKLLASLRDPSLPRPATLASVLAVLQAEASSPADTRVEEPAVVAERPADKLRIVYVPSADDLLAGSDPLLLLRELSELGTLDAVVDMSRLPALEDMDPERAYLGWAMVLTTRASLDDVREVFSFVGGEAQLEISRVGAVVPARSRLSLRPPGVAVGPAASMPPMPPMPPMLPIPRMRSISPLLALAAFAVPDSETGALVGEKAPPIQHGPSRKARATTPATDEKAVPAAIAAATAASTIRVATEKIDTLVNLVGELVIAQSIMVRALADRTSFEEAIEAAHAVGRLTKEVQERVMNVRMVQIRTVFSRLPRMVRALAAGLGKDIDLVVVGEDTEMDKSLVEQVSDPLLHLVRNAVDHGIESAEGRVLAKKSKTGRVTVRAFHQGVSVIIEVSDDGGGIDRDRLREKAVTAGFISAKAVLTDDELAELIFLPGLSTAKAVTEVSGRGVGMDVVRQNVAELGGTIHVETRRGTGSTFRLRLPLTLAVIDGQTVRVGGQTFVIPLGVIVASVRPRPTEVRSMPGGGEVFPRRGRMIPVGRLHRLLGVPGAVTEPEKAILVVVETGDGELALLVDTVLGQQSTVVKNLETNYRRVDGIMGATVDAQGGVTLILDVSALGRANNASASYAAPP